MKQQPLLSSCVDVLMNPNKDAMNDHTEKKNKNKINKDKEIENKPYIGSVYSWRPPQCKPSVWNLIQPRSLCICQFLVLHRFFKATGLFPEQTLPRGKVSPFEQGVFKNALHTTQSLNHVRAVVVQVPKLAIMSLMCPPEGILLQNLPRQ